MDVAATSARAIKCGYNFDRVKLKNQFLASESAANPGEAAKLPQIYDTAFNGVSKALAGEGADYCSELKVARIKLALTLTSTAITLPRLPNLHGRRRIVERWAARIGQHRRCEFQSRIRELVLHS